MSVPNQWLNDGGVGPILKLTAPLISSEYGDINGMQIAVIQTNSKNVNGMTILFL
jgi:hypothetical protein